MAYIPARKGKIGRENFLSRPRFLALSDWLYAQTRQTHALAHDRLVELLHAHLTGPRALAPAEVEAVLVDARTAELLQIDPAMPCLSVIRRTWSDDHLISYARLIHPGDRYKLRSLHKRRA